MSIPEAEALYEMAAAITEGHYLPKDAEALLSRVLDRFEGGLSASDEMIERAARALSEFFEHGHRGHYCEEWQAEGRCQLCVDAAHLALTAALQREDDTTATKETDD